MFSEKQEEKFYKEIFGFNYQANVPLASKSYMKTGGIAKHVVRLENIKQLEVFEKNIVGKFPYKILGKASNTLISDSEIKDLVVMPYWGSGNLDKVQRGKHLLQIHAGMPLARAVRFSQLAGFSGLEFALGIPGSVGGAICMNAGADGGEIKNILHSAFVLRDGCFKWVAADNLQLSYRSSNIKSNELIMAATFFLQPISSLIEKKKIRKMCLLNLQKRKQTQPLGRASLGSTFKNPSGRYAAKIIEDCYLKGVRVGGISVSTLHANFIVNDGTGTSAQAMALIEKMRTVVKEKTGILLQNEVRTMGTF